MRLLYKRYERIEMPVVINCSACLLLLLMTCDTAGNDKPITCHAGTFAPGQPAAVTCNLQAVDNAKGSGIHVVRYPPGAPEYDPGENVLVCAWVKETETHRCDVEIDGYTFSNDRNSAITVKIPSVTGTFAGLYMCFLVPPDGTQAHACDLIVRGERLPPTTTPETTVKKNETWMIGLIVVLIIAVISMAAMLGGLYWRRRNDPRPKMDDHVESAPLLTVVGGNECSEGQEDLKETAAYPDKRIMAHLQPFLVGPEKIKRLMQATQKELNAYSAPQTISNNTFCTTVHSLPKRTETGDFLVVNLGSRSLYVVAVKLHGEHIDTDGKMTYRIPTDVRLGTSKQLMEFIADRVNMFLKSNNLLTTRQSVGFILSFPCTYETDGDLTTACLARWTKGFCCRDVVQRKWRDTLQHALKKKIVRNLEIKAVVNDTVALFMSAVSEDEKCSIAVGLGNGFSTCYLQRGEDQCTSGDEINCTKRVIIGIEIGALGEDGSLDEFRTEFNITLDQNTVNQGKQILEKMISRLYLGEIVRLVLLKLIIQGLLFSTVYSKFTPFNEKGGFPTEHVALIQSDTSKDHSITKAVLYNLRVDHPDAEDCNIVNYVCRIVFQRSAFLAAAAIATLVKHVGQKVTSVGVDGSLYRSHPHFAKLLKAKIRELVGPEYKVTFFAKPGATGIGAALTAAISMSAETDQDTRSTKTHRAHSYEEPHPQI